MSLTRFKKYVYQGWMKNHYFVLDNGILKYFEKEDRQLPFPFGCNELGKMDLAEFNLALLRENDHSNILVLTGSSPQKNVILQCFSSEEFLSWREAVEAHKGYIVKFRKLSSPPSKRRF